MTRPARPSEGTPAAGRALYGENGCASCHEPSGRGDGPVGKTLAIPPRDFKDAQSFRNGRDATAITELKPGSFHIMLFDLKQHPADGATVDLTLTFDNGPKLPIKATVRTPEGMR